MRFKIAIALWLSLVLCPASWGQATAPASRPATQADTQPARFERVKLVLLHVNDVHGQTQERSVGGKSVGGYARLATAVGEVREKAAKAGVREHGRADLAMPPDEMHVLLFHAGDEFSRGDGLTRKTLGAANIELMNEIGFDAFTPGNGEFYDGWKNLRVRAKEAKFPFLMANVANPGDKDPPGKAFVILQAGPVKVAVFGLCYVHTELPSAWGLKVDDPIKTAAKLVPELRKQADVVVALTHIGLDQDKKLAAQVGGIDVIIGGHSHSLLEKGVLQRDPDGKDVLICQAGNYLEYLGRVTLELRRAGKGYRIVGVGADVIALDQKVRQDPKIKASIAKLAAATQPANQPTNLPTGIHVP